LKAQPLPASEPTALDSKDQRSHLYEGAVWFQGALHFSDFETTGGFPSRILKYENGALSVVVPDSGSNGLGLNPTGEALVAARHSTKSVSVRDGADVFEPVVSEHGGKAFNSPNDLVFRSDGNLYFTDPAFQAGPNPTQSTTNVYRVAPDGTVTAIDSSIRNPNGISLSPDEKTLYVAGNMEDGYVKSYPVDEDGSVGEGKVFLAKVAVPDGMVVDCAGNLYVTEHTKKRVRVVSPEGKELGQITGMDRNVTNVAFGGADRKTLFITGAGRLFQIGMPVPGMPY
jgi:gluconolactonase